MTKEEGCCVCVLCVPCLCMHLPVCMLRGCRTVTAVTQPRPRGGEKDGKGRIGGERAGENTGVE